MITVSQMKTQTAQAKKQPKVILQILIFFLVFLIAEGMMSVILTVPLTVWLVTDPAFIEACRTLDFDAIMRAVSSMPSWLVLLELALTVFEIIVPVFYCRKIEKRSYSSMGFSKKNAPRNYLVGLLIGACMISATLGLTVLLGGAEVTAAAQIPVGLILLYFFLYMIQGAGEEVLVRGFLMMSLTNSFKGKYRDVLALVISALVFAALHLGNPGMSWLAFVNLFFSGVTFGVAVFRTDNLFTACAMHTAWNFVQGNIFGVLVSGMDMNASVFSTTLAGPAWISGGDFGLEGGIATLAVELLTIVLFLVILPQKDRRTAAPLS